MGTEEEGKNDQFEHDDEQRTDGEASQDHGDAEDEDAAFSAGFNKVTKGNAGAGDAKSNTQDDSNTGAGKAAGEPTADDADAAGEPAAPTKQPWEEEFAKFRSEIGTQLRHLAGSLGGLNNQVREVRSAMAAAKAAAEKKGGEGAAPTDAQVQAALADPEAWKKLEEDFPDWAAPMKKELTALHEKLASAGQGQKVDVDKIKAEAKAEARAEIVSDLIEVHHEGWRDTVRTPEFANWLNSQPDDVRALAASERPRDAIKLLDSYKEFATKGQQGSGNGKDPAALEQERRKKRLEAGVNPKGTSQPVDTGLSDEAAFARGFNRVARKKVA